MTQEMVEFIEALQATVNGEVVTRHARLVLIDKNKHEALNGPDYEHVDPASYVLFLARVERILGLKGWNWA